MKKEVAVPYRLSVPVMASSMDENNLDVYLTQFRACGAERVLIASDRALFFSRDRQTGLSHLQFLLTRIRAEGYEVGIWIQGFGFGDKLTAAQSAATQDYVLLRSLDGRELTGHDAFCPTGGSFTADFCAQVKELAALRPDCILLDDDLCLSIRPGIGCFCDEHLRRLSARLGKKVDLDEMRRHAFVGGKNAYRDAFLSVMGDTLRDFCRAVRKAADEVDPSLRIGVCAGFTSFDEEGVDALELAKILAGGNEPLLRLTGAPYWVAKDQHRFPGQRLGTVIESTRAQEAFCRGKIKDVFHECDSYPRPSYHIPVSLTECFDVALRTSGGMGGLKYLFDYYASPLYEQAYLKKHIAHQKLYDFIAAHADGKRAVGVRIYDEIHKLETYDFGDPPSTKLSAMDTFFSPAAALLSQHAIPTVYDGDAECGIAFGESARYLDLSALPKKLILDAVGARILSSLGLDVGVSGFAPAPLPSFERYGSDRVKLSYLRGDYFSCVPAGDASVLSYFEADGALYPAAIRVLRGDTEFLIFCFDSYSEYQGASVFLSYGRASQLSDFLGSYPLADRAVGLYALEKVDPVSGDAFLLLLNICEDSRDDLSVRLPFAPSSFEICGDVSASLDGASLILSQLPAYGMAAISLRR